MIKGEKGVLSIKIRMGLKTPFIRMSFNEGNRKITILITSRGQPKMGLNIIIGKIIIINLEQNST